LVVSGTTHEAALQATLLIGVLHKQKRKVAIVSKRNLLGLSIAAIVLLVIGYMLVLMGINGLALAAFGAGIAVVAWILGLITTVRSRRYGWMIAIALTGVIGTLAYGLFGPPDITS
jgi:uncharacterized membrane protein